MSGNNHPSRRRWTEDADPGTTTSSGVGSWEVELEGLVTLAILDGNGIEVVRKERGDGSLAITELRLTK